MLTDERQIVSNQKDTAKTKLCIFFLVIIGISWVAYNNYSESEAIAQYNEDCGNFDIRRLSSYGDAFSGKCSKHGLKSAWGYGTAIGVGIISWFQKENIKDFGILIFGVACIVFTGIFNLYNQRRETKNPVTTELETILNKIKELSEMIDNSNSHKKINDFSTYPKNKMIKYIDQITKDLQEKRGGSIKTHKNKMKRGTNIKRRTHKNKMKG
jgi:hypothetical protein